MSSYSSCQTEWAHSRGGLLLEVVSDKSLARGGLLLEVVSDKRWALAKGGLLLEVDSC